LGWRLLKDGAWHCSNEIQALYIRDYRKRISEMNMAGYVIKSQVCDCERPHNAGVHKYRLEGEPTPAPKPVYYIRHPVTGARITSEQLAEL
jgi:hypothetical protein